MSSGTWTNRAAITALCAALVACGGGGAGPTSDTTPVTVAITRPTAAQAALPLEIPPMWGDAIVEGTARPANGARVASVRYEVKSATGVTIPDGTGTGTVITNGDGSATWRLPTMVPRPGINTVEVTVFDTQGRSGSASIELRTPPIYIAVDTRNKSIYKALRYADLPPGFRLTNPHVFVLARVPAGTYTVGSSSTQTVGYDPAQDTMRTVSTPAYYVSLTEITRLHWGNMTADADLMAEAASTPMTDISRGDVATTLLAFSPHIGLDLRLPTSTEWEIACRASSAAGAAYAIPTTADPTAYAVSYTYGQPQGAAQVGTRLPNPWGFYDMHGNVLEITSDGGKDGSWTENWVFQRASSSVLLPADAIHPCVGFRPALNEILE